jgi:hypothetical protein
MEVILGLMFVTMFAVIIGGTGLIICALLYHGLLFLLSSQEEGKPSESARAVVNRFCICCVAIILVAIAFNWYGAFNDRRQEDQLVSAARMGDTKTVERILRTGIAVDANSDETRFTPLMSAACEGHTDTVKALLRYHPDLNKPGDFGTALSLARTNHHPDTARILEDAGATE